MGGYILLFEGVQQILQSLDAGRLQYRGSGGWGGRVSWAVGHSCWEGGELVTRVDEF